NGMVDGFTAAGIAAGKIGIGIDFYAYVWSGGSGTPAGGATEPRQSWSSAPSVQSNLPYSSMMQTYYQPQYVRWDASAQAAYLDIDNAGSANDKFISYDDETTCQKKVQYTRDKGIGGVIIWELGGGYLPASFPNRDRLLQAVKQALGGGGTPAIPAAPVLASPADGATGIATSPTLSWNASSGAASYRLQVSASSAFTTTVIDQSALSAKSSAISGLVASTAYYWRVNASNSSGTSAWSAVSSFTTVTSPPPVPAAPVLASPANGATGVAAHPALAWDASSGAASYRLQVSPSSSFSTTVADQSGITATSCPLTGLQTSTIYYWRVNATNSAGTSAWSGASGFTTITTPPPTSSDLWVSQDRLLAPWIDASWAATVDYSNAEQHYDGTASIKVVQNSWGGLSVHDGNWGAPVNINCSAYKSLDFAVYTPMSGVSLSVRLENDLGSAFPGVSHGSVPANQWIAISIPMSQLNPAGQPIHRVDIMEGSGSSKTFFIDDIRFVGSGGPQLPPSPVLSSPANGSSGVATNPTLSWNASSGAATYRLQVSASSAFSTTAVDQSGISATSSAVSGLLNSTTYYWRVCAANSAGAGNWSNTSSFSTTAALPQVLAAPALYSPWNYATTTGATQKLVWKPSAGATLYRVQVSINPNFSTLFCDQAGIPSTSLSLGGFINGTVYYWRVSASNASATSPWSGIYHFLVRTNGSALPSGTSILDQVENIVTESYGLAQNFPNPFNPTTTIEFDLLQPGHATLKIYNAAGEEVATLIEGDLPAGRFQAVWNANGVPSGTYFYRLMAGGFSQTRKLVLMK
ncbi:MAG TPA: glycosyl hydrolase family 18 protein, partial [Bacteroidota bacterium]|nr:glycosyl hydrolase family 18 protein [Bacteroidota bacterium]